MPSPPGHRPTWAEIDLENLAFNLRSVKRFIGPEVEYMAVVKANGYGHGAVECARRLETEGVDWFGVALPEEGAELRSAGIGRPILCLGGFFPGQEELIVANRLTPAIISLDQAESLDRFAGERGITADVHIKIDTGMGRVGIRHDEIGGFVERLLRLKDLRVEGLMTHFAVADKLAENEFTNRQISQFQHAVSIFTDRGFHPKYLDLANSPGAVAHPYSRGNMVRLGGVLYGLGGDVLPQEIPLPELRPVMSVYTKIAVLKNVPSGETLGYGRTFMTKRDSVIATIPIGYHDGLSRSLSNRGSVIVNGRLAPIAGRISMDWTIIDVTDIPEVAIGTDVVVIGSQGEVSLTAEAIAETLGTISYEVTCAIDGRVPRSFI